MNDLEEVARCGQDAEGLAVFLVWELVEQLLFSGRGEGQEERKEVALFKGVSGAGGIRNLESLRLSSVVGPWVISCCWLWLWLREVGVVGGI